MGTSWLSAGLLVLVAALLLKYAKLQFMETCAYDMVGGYARRRSVRKWLCGVMMECVASKDQKSPVTPLCNAFRVLDWLLEQVPPLQSVRESLLTATILFLLIYKDNVSAILEDWGFPGLGGWRWTVLDGGDAEADLPELEEVSSEAGDGLPPEGGQQPGLSPAGAGVDGQHRCEGASGHAPRESGGNGASSMGACQQCEKCRAGGGGSGRVTVSKRVRPEGWLVYDKVVGVVPYEVLEHWKTEEEGRRRGQEGHAVGNGHVKGHEGLADAGGSAVGPRPRVKPPVRRPPKPEPGEASAASRSS